LLALDSPNRSAAALDGAASGKPDTNHPRVAALGHLAESARRGADAAKAGHGPSLQVSARTSRDYPNGPVLESIHQNTVNVSATLPLFEGNRVVREVEEQKNLARAEEKRRDQAAADLSRDWEKARDQLEGLRDQESINRQSVAETEELSRL